MWLVQEEPRDTAYNVRERGQGRPSKVLLGLELLYSVSVRPLEGSEQKGEMTVLDTNNIILTVMMKICRRRRALKGHQIGYCKNPR